MTLPERIAAFRALVEKTTPGEWRRVTSWALSVVRLADGDPKYPYETPILTTALERCNSDSPNNLAFCIAAHNDLPALINDLEAENAALRAQLVRMDDMDGLINLFEDIFGEMGFLTYPEDITRIISAIKSFIESPSK